MPLFRDSTIAKFWAVSHSVKGKFCHFYGNLKLQNSPLFLICKMILRGRLCRHKALGHIFNERALITLHFHTSEIHSIPGCLPSIKGF